MMFSRDELINITGAEVLKRTNNGVKSYSVSTDTRTIKSGEIYLPLKGETFDGENFINNALESGADAYFTSKNIVNDKANFILQTDDTLNAYLKIAGYYRQKINPITVAVTGSSGKTTTKEIIYSVLSQKYKTQKTFSNHNNEIGFCQTVLSMEPDTEALIVEGGMRGLGEIELISNYLMPDYAVITNSGCAHIGRLGSLDNIAKAKCEITAGLKPEGAFIALNQDIIKKHVKFAGEKIYYSLSDVEVLERKLSYSKFRYKGEVYELNVDGDYNIENSLAAIELGKKVGMSADLIRKGLTSYRPIEKRWEIEQIGTLRFINDSYNANPESVKASVKTFIELYENPIVVLGDMGELGNDEVLYHRQVGEYLADFSKKVKYLTVGKLAREIAEVLTARGFDVKCFNTNDEASRYILDNSNNGNTIFLKASRSMKFERILENVKRGMIKK